MSSPDNDLSARTPTTIKSIKDADLHDLVTAIGAEKTACHCEKLKNYKELSSAELQEIKQQLANLERRETNLLKDKVSI